MKKILLILLCIVFCSLIGCNNKDDINKNASSDYDWLPSAKNEDELLLYDKYDQRIISFDKKNYNVTGKNTTQNYMQFEFNDLKANIYTTGHSIENNYKIIEKKCDKTSVLYEMKENEAIFPLAYKNEQIMYFLKTTYDSSGKEIYNDRVVCKFELKNKQLKELNATKGFLTSNAVIIDNLLYFTVYNEENNNYDLYRIDVNEEDKTVLINTGLITGELYNNNGRLLVSNQDKIYDYEDNTIYFPKKILNYFYLNRLFQIDINNEGDLRLTITNIETNKIENTFDKVVDVRVQNDKVYVYTTEQIIAL